MFTKKFRKYLSIGLILLILFVKSVGPAMVLAEGEDITPTPSETQSEEAPTSTETQTQEEPLTVSEEPTPTPTDTNIEVENTGELNNNIDSTSNTGENTATQSAESTVEPEITTSESTNSTEGSEASEDNNNEENQNDGSEINTGDAVSITEVENAINTNIINSKIVNHTINLFVDENGDIDLSDPFSIAEEIVVQDNNSEEVINVLATNATNYAYLSNDIVTISDTGSNTIEGSKEAMIKTGNAYSITSLLNQVNFTIEGSVIHLITINIFGNLTGNIILPEFSSLENCNECGMSTSINNEAVVNNNVDSYANSGENEIEYSESGEIKTGNAVSVVNLANLINTNLIGLLLFNLTVNNFGNWDGEFLGWGNIFGQQNGQNGLALNFISNGNGNGCPTCTGDVSVYNSAYVENNISSLANTGGNSINGENGEINTGNAYSAVTLANFVNTNIINSVGFFGFVNIFGNLSGNIGGFSHFITPTPEPEGEAEVLAAAEGDVGQVREEGGLLEVTQGNNVGEYVNPGDTVTFFIDVKNPGTGKIYDTKLYLYLVYEGENVGGTSFDLGTIEAGKTTKVTTGFVLSNTAPLGNYTTVALARGLSGEGQQEIIATSESTFNIGEGFGTLALSEGDDEGEGESLPAGILGTSEAQGAKGLNPAKVFMILYSGLVLIYLMMRAFNKRAYLTELFGRGISLRKRAYSFRSFLL